MRQIEITEQPIVSLSVDEGVVSYQNIGVERSVKGFWVNARGPSNEQTRTVRELDWDSINRRTKISRDFGLASLVTLAIADFNTNHQITSVNVHPLDLADQAIQKHFALSLEIEASNTIAIEVLESGPNLLTVPEAVNFLHQIKEVGAKIWLDDLDSPGAVHTLEWLKEIYPAKKLCVDAIKLERRRLADWQITNALTWAYGNGIMTVIEQVESEEERDHLLELVVAGKVDLNYVLWQGYLWGRAKPIIRPRKSPPIKI